MKLFDFDKFSRSTWYGSLHNHAWKKYGIATTDDAAKDVRGEHNFLNPTSKWGQPTTERCVCGWKGNCWADHLEDEINASQVTPQPQEEAPVAPKKAKKAE